MKDKKIYIAVVVFIILGAVCFISSINVKEKAKVIDYDKDYEKQSLDNYQYQFIKKYDDYLSIIEQANESNIKIVGQELTEDKFNGSRYLILIENPSDCHLSLDYSNTKYDDKSYKIYFNTDYDCNKCSSDKHLYQIKVGASDTEKITIFYKNIKKTECNDES